MVGRAVQKRSILALLIVLFTLSPWSKTALASSWDLGIFTIKRDSVRIPVESGVDLIGTIYQKRGQKNQGPLVLLLNPWSIGSWVYGIQANALADQGFTVLSYNLRGWAGSGGEADIGGEVDVKDVSRVIDWVSAHEKADVSRVGIGGVSLGAGVALNAAAFDSRIRAVASLSTWTDLYTPIYGNFTKRVYWDGLLWVGSIVGTGGTGASRLKETYEAIEKGDYGKIHDYADPRSPVYYLDRFAVNKPAILLSQNLSDILFPVSDVWRFFEHLPTPKKLNFQPGVHATAEITGMFLPFKDKVWDDAIEWFNRWLKPNHPSHESQTSEVQINLRNGKVFKAAKTRDLSPATSRYYLTRHGEGSRFGALALEPEDTGVHAINSGHSSGVVSNIPMIGALISETKIFQSRMKEEDIRLDQAALYELSLPKEGFDLLGLPKIHLSMRIEGDPATFITHLFRLDKKGVWHLISMTPYTLRDIEQGGPQTSEFDLYGAFEEFEAGDRLVLAIDTRDPEFKTAGNDFRIYLENNGESWIELPLNLHSSRD